MTQDDKTSEEIAYHLPVDPRERAIAAQALRLLISDEAHEEAIRALARAVLAQLAENTETVTTVGLTPPQMKILHTALRLMLDDTRREQSVERGLLHSVIGKLPDEHSIRAIELP